MLRKYMFFDGGERFSIEFDDEKPVLALASAAYFAHPDKRPFRSDILTVFQARRGNFGWITTAPSRLCRDEIGDRKHLCFAYYVPDIFYYAEGGWGHHMKRLGGRPVFKNEKRYAMYADDKWHTSDVIVTNGAEVLPTVSRYLVHPESIRFQVTQI